MFRVPWHRRPMIDAMERSRQRRRQGNIDAERQLRAGQPEFHHELIRRLATLKEIQSHDIDGDTSLSTLSHEPCIPRKIEDESMYKTGNDVLPTIETDDASRLEEEDDWEAIAAAIDAEVNTGYLDPRPKSKGLYTTTSLGESQSTKPKTLDQWLSIASDMNQEKCNENGQDVFNPIHRAHSNRNDYGKYNLTTPQQLHQSIEPYLRIPGAYPEDWIAMSEAARAVAETRAESARRGKQLIDEFSRARQSNQFEGERSHIQPERTESRGSRRRGQFDHNIR
ncbi:hypothetical protein F5Y02DRAFT_298773 [Annulohypoxylon stygium]|nr:hypothetical protein F5Y02DRAFT_298773 [Annulohypoxylon stygium]